MDVRNLKTFLKVAEIGNFTRAATALGYSQSAVTVQMQQLEQEVGVPLFDRIGKNISLTLYGTSFIEYATRVIEAIDKAQNFASDSNVLTGTVRFGIVDTILNAVFISIIPEFNRRYPNINVSVFVGSAREIETKMRSGDLDIAYMLDYKMPKKEWVRVREELEPLIFVTNPQSSLADKKVVPFEELIKEKIILMPQGEGYRYIFDEEVVKRNLNVVPSVELMNAHAILKMVEEYNYVSLLPVFYVRRSVREGKLIPLTVPGCEMSQWSQLVYHKGKVVTTPIQVFTDTVLSLLPPVQTEPARL